MFIELFIKNLNTMTYHKSLLFEIELEGFSFLKFSIMKFLNFKNRPD